MQSTTSPKKPSHLSFGSPRSSPFRRPESPVTRSPSNANENLAATPSGSPLRSRQHGAGLQPLEQTASPTVSVASTIFSPQSASTNARPTSSASTATPFNSSKALAGDALSKLNPVQVREMRESFQVLDRDNDGQVNREDVAEILGQLGLDASSSSTASYFPHSTPQTMNLSTYLSTLSSVLGELSRADELNAAFAAFDVDDSGQIDAEELRDALLNTPAERGGRSMTGREIERVMEGFTARRVLGKDSIGKGRGDVFRYADFVTEIQGGAKGSGSEAIKT